MQLAYISPVSVDTLMPFMIVEAPLVILNIPLFAFYMYVLLKIRFHNNLKMLCFIGAAQYFPSLFTRLITIAYQMQLIPLNGTPETTILLIVATFFRYYHFGICLSFSMFVLIERHLAMVYIEDYEKRSRIWIAIVLTIVYSTYSATFVLGYIYDILSWQVTIAPAMILGISGSLLFKYVEYKAKRMVKELEKTGLWCQVDYSLSLRYQLEENLWSCKLLQNGILSVGLINCTGMITYVAAQMGSSFDFISENTAQMLDCIFNICVAVNGPLLGIGTIIFNDYLKKLVKSTLISDEVHRKGTDEGQMYFEQLQQQWNF